MNDVVIKAENLGKKYTIGHQAENGRYVALRDVLVNNARTFWRTTTDLLRGKPIIQGNELEEVWALKDVSFEIRRGEAVGIIGRNGAGKSTLLKVLSRITEPSAGRVTIRGRVSSLLEVGTGFHPELTGRENVYLNGAILGMTRAEVKRKFDEIVAFAEIEKFLDTPVKRYSSGMYVRLAFAVAAHLEPEILLVDEVLAVGDAAFQKKCLGKMEDVAGSGRTVLFVSHNMGAIRSLCSCTVWLDGGEVKEIASSDQAIASYLSAFDQEGPCRTVQKSQHIKGNQSVVIQQVAITDNQGVLKDSFLIGEPINVQLNYQADQQTSGTFWCFVSSADDKVLLSSFQKDVMPPYELSDNGTVMAKLKGLSFLPGRYRLTAGIFDTSNNILDWVEGIASFEILPHFFDGRAFDHRYGLLTQELEWEISKK